MTVRSRVEARLTGKPRLGAAARSPLRDAVPAASAQAAALTRTPALARLLPPARTSTPRLGLQLPGSDAEAGTEEARRCAAPPPRPAGANWSPGPPRTRPAQCPRTHGPPRSCACPGRPGHSHTLRWPHDEPE